MDRLWAREGEVRARRGPRRRAPDPKPELVATGPHQVGSWEITTRKGPGKWSYDYLYVIRDLYRREVVGCMVAQRARAALAHTLIQLTCDQQGSRPGP